MNNKTSINVILDSSGSMLNLMQDTLGGFNKFIADQRDLEGEVIFTLCTFSNDYRLMHDCVPLASVENLTDKTYSPGGGTALLDAMGATIESVSKKIAAMQEADRPSKTIYLVITDGEENQSKNWTHAKLKSLVQDQEKNGAQFIFLGANLDAFTQASTFGFSAQNSINYKSTNIGTRQLYSSISASVGNYRSDNKIGSTMDFMSLKDAIENNKEVPSNQVDLSVLGVPVEPSKDNK